VAGSTPLSDPTAAILAGWKQRWEGQGIGLVRHAGQQPLRGHCATLCRGGVARRQNRPIGLGPHRPGGGASALGAGWCWGHHGPHCSFPFFTLAEYPMNWIDGAVAGAGDMGERRHARPETCGIFSRTAPLPAWAGSWLFLPQILILFFFLGLLESTGYMARAAFIMDRLMSRVGLNGKSFIPLLGSYACAIPGIMATRTIEDPKDRLVTILVAPLMSCSARLPVYLLMIAALLPGDRVSVGAKVGLMLLMYALGTFGAFGFAWLFKKYLLKGEPPLMIMELPLTAGPAVERRVVPHAGTRRPVLAPCRYDHSRHLDPALVS